MALLQKITRQLGSLADLDTVVLEQLISGSVAEVRRRYGWRGGA
jgi:hypothetical protein